MAELNYVVFDTEMLAVVFSLRKCRIFLQGVELKTIVHSDHQNVTYFKTARTFNRGQV